MAMTAFAGPIVSWGQMDYILASLGGPVPDFNQDAGPSFLYQGFGIPDLRVLFQKDRASGLTGVVPGAITNVQMLSANVIPAALGTAIIAPLANAVSGTAMTLASTNSVAVGINIPIVPIGTGQSAWQSGPVVTAPIVLDFGFAYGTALVNTNSWTVADSSVFTVGMPLVIAGAGAAGAVLLTWVSGITSGTVITTNDNALTAVTAAAIGMGNLWTPREGVSVLYPTAHAPFRASGIGAFLDPTQALARCVSVTGVSGGAGGAFAVAGWDSYWQPMNETITATAGATTAYGKKAFKAIKSVTPAFSDAHNYSIGTADVFGFHWMSSEWESTTVSWAGASMTSSTGWTGGLVLTTTPTATTADVRGTIQTGAGGGGSGIGSTASNGTISSLARSGNRLWMGLEPRFLGLMAGSPFNPAPLFGSPQF